MEPIQLNYSEENFDGFNQVSIYIDTTQIQVTTIVPEHLKERRDKQLAIDDFMHSLGSSMGVNHKGTPTPIYMEGQGNLQWHNLQTICYYQHKEPSYSFRIKLIDYNNNVVDIQGKSTTKKAVSKNTITNDNILDAPTKSTLSDSEETAYLKAMYRTLVNTIEPIATKQLVAYYQQNLANTTIDLDDFSIQHEGFAIPYKQWFIKKIAIIPWDRIAIKHHAKYTVIGDKEQTKYQVQIPYYRLQNANALVALVKAKQQEQKS